MISEEDQNVVNQIEQGDQILSVTVEGNTSELLNSMAETIAAWNDILEEEFPNLKKEEIAQ